jgi:hypothetical protein
MENDLRTPGLSYTFPLISHRSNWPGKNKNINKHRLEKIKKLAQVPGWEEMSQSDQLLHSPVRWIIKSFCTEALAKPDFSRDIVSSKLPIIGTKISLASETFNKDPQSKLARSLFNRFF